MTAPITPGDRVSALPTPVLVADLDRVERNITAMAAAVAGAGVALRPHFKTSKSPEIARRQIAAGATGFTAATAAEVAALIDHGFTDVFWAHNPASPAKAAQAAAFAARARVAVGIDDPVHVRLLDEAATAADVTVPVRIEVDTGLHRTGVAPETAVELARLVDAAGGLRLDGVYTHEGQLASLETGRDAIRAAGRASGALLVDTADRIRAEGVEVAVVSVGSTPGWDSAPFAPGVTEARAGTYVFYDANQLRLESASHDQCALTVIATVVSVQRDGGVVIDAGLKAMSSDGSNRGRTFGLVLDAAGAPDPTVEFPTAYEEHGILTGDGTAHLAVGDRVRILPNHACGVVNMWSTVVGVRDEVVEDLWSTVGRH